MGYLEEAFRESPTIVTGKSLKYLATKGVGGISLAQASEERCLAATSSHRKPQASGTPSRQAEAPTARSQEDHVG